ncbi:MAG: restriction endonuclease subunit S, partial [Mycoplasma sp.]
MGEKSLIERGGSPRPIDNYISDDGELNWIKISDAPKFGNYITKTKQKIIKEGLRKTRQVFKGELILSNSMSFGKPYIMKIDGCIHDGWLVIKKFLDTFIPEYLLHYLSSNFCIKQYKSFAAGGVVNNLSKDIVSQILINFPNIDEQQKIAKLLSLIDQKIETQRKIIEEYSIIKNNSFSIYSSTMEQK